MNWGAGTFSLADIGAGFFSPMDYIFHAWSEGGSFRKTYFVKDAWIHVFFCYGVFEALFLKLKSYEREGGIGAMSFLVSLTQIVTSGCVSGCSEGGSKKDT